MRFRLLAGQHIQTDPDGQERLYKPGQVLEAKADLATRWPEKFGRVAEGTPLDVGMLTRVPPSESVADAAQRGFDPATSNTGALPPSSPLPAGEDTFSHMTLNELKAFAAEEEIDLKGARTKEEILAVLRKSTAQV